MWHDAGWMWFPMLAFWVLAVVAAYLVLSSRRGSDQDAGVRRPGSDILDERYARGEITAEEYHERRATLTRAGAPPGREGRSQAPTP